MKCKQRINKFIRNYDDTIEKKIQKLAKIKDKKALIRIENEIEAISLEYKDLYKRIKDYIVPYLDFMQKYENNIETAQQVNKYINEVGK